MIEAIASRRGVGALKLAVEMAMASSVVDNASGVEC